MNPFTEGLYVILQRNRYVGRDREAGSSGDEEKKKGEEEEILGSHMNFTLPFSPLSAHFLAVC